jgi:hypothetical protein
MPSQAVIQSTKLPDTNDIHNYVHDLWHDWFNKEPGLWQRDMP